MARAGPTLPFKRRLEETETNNVSAAGPIVIELSDTESDTPSWIPPAKRQKSHTPAETNSHTRLPSRGRSENAKPTLPSASSAVSVTLRTSQLNRVYLAGSQSVPTHSLSKQLPKSSTKQIQIYDLTFDPDSSPSPPSRQASTTLPTRNSRNNGSPAIPLVNRVQTVRQVNTSQSPYTSPPENGPYMRRKDVSHSRSSTPSNYASQKRRSDAGDRTVKFLRNDPLRNQLPTASQSSVLTDFTLEIPGKRNASYQPTKQASFQVMVDSPINLLEQFQRPLPMSKVQRHAERKEIWSSLKQSTKLAHENLTLVESHFGQTGFSKAYSTEDKEELAFMRHAASKKKKLKINRANINLEIESLIQSIEDLNVSKRLTHPSRTARDILTSRFNERFSPPLTFSNDVNSKRLHGKFQFINRYIIGDKVKLTSSSSMNKGCGCSDCSLSSCLCFRKRVKDRDGKGSYDAQLKTYSRRPDGIVVLSDDFLTRELNPATDKYEITECNESCGCGSGCWNRVVGNGRTVPLEIFQTEKCGFGVRSSQDIMKGQFIELYLGEVITETELLCRDGAENDDDPSYIYSLDWLGSLNNNTTYHVDGKYFGSAMRFVNHSCVPNTRCFAVQIHEDRKSYYLAFFAIRDIKAGLEIRIDYHSEGTASGSSQEDSDHQEHGVSGPLPDGLSKCYCGEKICRGIIWQPGVKTRRRRRQGD